LGEYSLGRCVFSGLKPDNSDFLRKPMVYSIMSV
jgi:hypothetical protein